MLPEQALQVLQMRLHRLGVDAADVDELMVVAVHEIALQVEHVRKASGEPRAEVDTRAPENTDDASRHVLAAMVARSLDDGERAGVAHRKALAGDACREDLATRGAVEAGIAHDNGALRHEARLARMPQNQFACGHSLADIVVGVALQIHVEAAGVPDPEALTDVPGQAHRERGILHPVVPPTPGDLARDARADRAVEVLDGVAPFAAALALNGREHLGDHPFSELALVERRVRRGHAELRHVGRQAGVGQDRPQIELALPGGTSRQHFQMPGAADEVLQAPHAERRENLADLARDEQEVVHDHLGQADEELRAQHAVLGRNSRGAVVQVADAQVLAAQGDHRCRPEAEAFGSDQRSLDDIEAGLQPAVGLQAHAMPQIVRAQRLMRLRQPQFPGGAGVLDG